MTRWPLCNAICNPIPVCCQRRSTGAESLQELSILFQVFSLFYHILGHLATSWGEKSSYFLKLINLFIYYLFLFILFFNFLFLFSYNCLHFLPITPPQPVPPPSPTSTLSLDFVLVSFIVAPTDPSPHPLPTPLWLLLHCS